MIWFGSTSRVKPFGGVPKSPDAVSTVPSLFLRLHCQSVRIGRPGVYPAWGVSVTTADVRASEGFGSHWKAAIPVLLVRHVRAAWSLGFVGFPHAARRSGSVSGRIHR